MPTKMSMKKKIGSILMALPVLMIEYAMRIIPGNDEQPPSGPPSNVHPQSGDTLRPS